MMRYGILIALIVLLSMSAMAQDCPLPAEFTNHVTVQEADLEITFATDKYSYTQTDTVWFYLSVKNNGSETFHDNWGIDPQNAAAVLPEG